MNLLRELGRGIRATLVLWFLVAVIYPFSMLAIGQILFSQQANGSLIKNSQGQVIGSALIGQSFTSDRYFNSRPSTTNYSSTAPTNAPASMLKTGVSSASNFAPSNPALLERVQGEMNRLKQAGITPTADLVYTSASSLDPHITIEAANAQIQRISSVRNLPSNRVEILVQQNLDRRFLGIFEEPGVNVLKLDLALDNLQ